MPPKPSAPRLGARPRLAPAVGALALALYLPASGVANLARADAATVASEAPGTRAGTGLAMSGTSLLYATAEERERNFDRIEESGARWIRIDIAASQITWGPDQYNWEALDEVVSQAERRGIQVLGALSGLPTHQVGEGTPVNHGPANDAEVAIFADFAGKVAERYASRIAAWEIWGEANRTDTWNPAPNAVDYVRTLRAARTAIDKVAPQSTIVLGGAGGATQPGDISSSEWLQDIYAAGGKDAFEAVGAHSWAGSADRDPLAENRQLRSVTSAQGDADKDIWWTMVGMPSGGSGMPSEQDAAAMITAAASQTATAGFGPTFFYTLDDQPQDASGARLGFFRPSGEPKASWDALKKVNGTAETTALAAPAKAGADAPAPQPTTSTRAEPIAATTAPAPAPQASSASPSSSAAASEPAVQAQNVETRSTAERTGVSVTGTSLFYTTQEKRDRDLDRIAAAGGKWLRLDFAASEITWASQDQYDWSRMDAVIDGANRRGLKVLGVLSGLPSYARPAGAPQNYAPANDGERAAFAHFAEVSAKRYGTRVAAWEIWNEPNLSKYWAPAPNAGSYMALMSTTRNRIKAVNPSATVVSGGTGGANGGSDVDMFVWLQQLYDHGLAANSDAVGVHLYTHPFNKNLGEFLRLDAYREVLDRNGDETKQLWATEAGGSNGGASPIDENLGAQLLEQSMERWGAMHHHGPMMVYTLYDEGGQNFMGYLGLMRQDGSPKPVYSKMQQLTR